jgi:hypothetical protein
MGQSNSGSDRWPALSLVALRVACHSYERSCCARHSAFGEVSHGRSRRLLGTWRMVSCQDEFIATGERVDYFGPSPVGYISYHSDGRMMALVISNNRSSPEGPVPTDQEKIALFDSFLAYAGTYTFDDEKVVHHVDASWNQTWTGTDQVRFHQMDGNTLTLTGAPATDPYTGQEVVYRMVFRKVPDST